jgi:hypothetical protein
VSTILAGKRLSAYVAAVFGAAALVIAVVYWAFTAEYSIFNGGVVASLALVAVIGGVLFAATTAIDSYLLILSAVCASLALALFAADSIGTVNDWLNDVVFMGSGAPINGVFGMAIALAALTLITIMASFLGRGPRAKPPVAQ